MQEILAVKNISKNFYNKKSIFRKTDSDVVQALKDVSFSVYKGESFGIVGESGSGKSTLANIIMGIVEADSGDIIFNQKNEKDFTNEERKEKYLNLQMVFQDAYTSLDPRKTIGWSIQEALIIQDIGTKEERKERAIDMLRDVGLDETYYEKFPHELSGGQLQRVSIASAVISKPELIVIDEGVSALDVSIQAAILNLLNDIKVKYNLTYIFIAHDLNVIQYFCDRVAVMNHGDLLEIYDPNEFNEVRHHHYTEKLFDAIPQIYLEEI